MIIERIVRGRLGGDDAGAAILGKLIAPSLAGLILCLAKWALDSLGWLTNRRIVEARRSEVPQESIRMEDVVEIRPSRLQAENRLMKALGCMIALLVVSLLAESGSSLAIGIALSGPILFGFVYLYNWLESDIPLIRLDETGVTTRRSRVSLRLSRVPWTEIDSCVTVSDRDLITNDAVIYPQFYKADGHRISSPGPHAWRTMDRTAYDRMLRYLNGRFPKLDIDPWDTL